MAGSCPKLSPLIRQRAVEAQLAECELNNEKDECKHIKEAMEMKQEEIKAEKKKKWFISDTSENLIKFIKSSKLDELFPEQMIFKKIE